MRRIISVWLLATFVLATVSFAEAQQSSKIGRVGLLGGMSAASFGDRMKVFRGQISELGYVEGKNITFEQRWADGKFDRLPDLVAELIAKKVDVLVTFGGAGPATVAKKATSTIPIVMAAGGSDPEAAGLIASLAHPGGNVTGLANMFTELRGKQMEILKETVVKLSRVAIIWNPDSPSGDSGLKVTESEARALGLKFQSLEFRKADDLENLFRTANKGRAQAMLVTANPLVFTHSAKIANLAIKNRLPTIHAQREFVEAGGLMMYGPLETDIYRRAAVYVDKILKGAKAADLPVERPMRFEFIINLKTANQIGLTIPQWTLMKADRVIR